MKLCCMNAMIHAIMLVFENKKKNTVNLMVLQICDNVILISKNDRTTEFHFNNNNSKNKIENRKI